MSGDFEDKSNLKTASKMVHKDVYDEKGIDPEFDDYVLNEMFNF